ncbi:hypothetical protein [Planktotalea arctica]|uniref:hypothetical protein n=1 Tax=Planktotalea arctica TaxID=1481893 RepID=UPI003219E1C3
MAYVTKFEQDDRDIKNLHPTQVVCKYIVAEHDGKSLLQLNTYGSDKRDVPGKLSQTLQIGESAARELLAILKKEFGDD